MTTSTKLIADENTLEQCQLCIGRLLAIIHDDITHARQKDHAEVLDAANSLHGRLGTIVESSHRPPAPPAAPAAKPDELAAEREAMVQRAERHCYTLPAGGYVQWNWKSHADFALTELAAAKAEIERLNKRIVELEASEKSLRTVIDTSKGTATSFVDLIRKRVSRGNEFDIGDVEDIARCVVELADRLADVEARPATVVQGAQK